MTKETKLKNSETADIFEDDSQIDVVDTDGSTQSSDQEAVEENKDEPIEEVLSPELQKINDLEKTILNLQESERQAKDEALRSLAELENFRKRKQQEVVAFKKYAAEPTVLKMITVLDNFILACNHLEQLDDTVKKELEGVILIRKQFLDALLKVDVKTIDALDQAFDPNFHQAVSQETVEGTESGIVVKELQKGFLLHDRVIRPSMVVVSV
jgi:molecular chaperone GrpE